MSERSERTDINDTPIVVGYDGSAGAEAALSWAMTEAARLCTRVRLVHVLHWPAQLAAVTPAPPVYPDERTVREAEKYVREAAEAGRRDRPGVAVTGHVRVGGPVPELVAESAGARIVVLGHRGHDGFSGLHLGSVGVAVSAQAHCPVVIIRGPGGARGADDRPDPHPGYGLGTDEQVLVGFDGTPCAAGALGVAFQAAAARGIGVRILHAWRPPVPRWKADVTADPLPQPWGDEQVEELALAEHIAVVDAIQPWRRRHPRVPVTVDVVADSASHALIAASARASLVVVGSCGHGGLRRLLFGSVSRQLVHHADCPVVVVHELPHSEVSAASA